MTAVTHYADEAPGYPPICDGGAAGDRMSFFPEDVTCPGCLATFGAPAENGSEGEQSLSVTDPYADLDAYVVADLPEFDDDQPPPTAIDLPDIERRLRRIRVLTDTLHELEQVAKDDKARIDAWLEERSAIIRREVDWWTASVENWHRAHVRENGAKTVSLPSGTLSLRQGSQRIEPLTKAPSELVPDEFARVKREWDRNAVKAATAPGPVAEGVQAPQGYVAHWAVDANGERVPDVVRLVPVADTFSVKVS